MYMKKKSPINLQIVINISFVIYNYTPIIEKNIIFVQNFTYDLMRQLMNWLALVKRAREKL